MEKKKVKKMEPGMEKNKTPTRQTLQTEVQSWGESQMRLAMATINSNIFFDKFELIWTKKTKDKEVYVRLYKLTKCNRVGSFVLMG